MTDIRHATLKSLLLAATMLAGSIAATLPSRALADLSVGVSVQIAPPELPVYEQPPMPDEGYIWVPGYWAWADPDGYYWVPGTWVQPPTAELLWTPPYWGWENGVYLFHAGYWGPTVGFYGGVNYGFGYGGRGYEGGRWDHDRFVYNSSVNNFGSVHVTNTYVKNVTVINETHVSYVGGNGGVRAEPTAEERAADQQRHVPPTAQQTQHIDAAKGNPEFSAKRNNGHPQVAATTRPAQFEGAGVSHPRPATTEAAPPRPQQQPPATQAAPAPRPQQQPPAAEHAAPAPRPQQQPPAAEHAAPPPRPQQPPPAAHAAPPPRPQQPAAAPPPRPQQQPPAAHAAPPPAHPPAAAPDKEKKPEQ